MIDALLDLVRGAMGSPWIYLALFAFAAIDAFFPVVPSESLVITAGVFAASGEPNLLLVMGVAALGAFVGDHVSYFAGRAAGGRMLRRARPDSRRRAALDWAARALTERGGLILVVARYVPGGRTAATMTLGGVGYPQRSFSLFAGLAAVSWGVYSALIGYLGGMAFEHDPLRGLLAGFGLAVAITVLAEIVRHRRRRRRPGAGPDDPAGGAADADPSGPLEPQRSTSPAS